MFGNPQRYKVSLQQYETRHANAGCLLALLFAVPFLMRNYSFSIVCCCTLVYVGLIVPLATGYISMGSLITLAKRVVIYTFIGNSSLLRSTVCHTASFLQWLHCVFQHLEHIHTTTNQVAFNLAAEKIMCPEEKFASLYVLLFYSVLAYLQQSLKKRQWSQLMHETTAADFVRLTTAFVVARMGKAVVMGLVLLTFTVHFNDIEPPLPFIVLTATFFFLTQFPGLKPVCCTNLNPTDQPQTNQDTPHLCSSAQADHERTADPEPPRTDRSTESIASNYKVFCVPGQDSIVVEGVRRLNLYELEGLEEWWVPMVVRATAIVTSAVMTLLLAFRGHYLMALLLGHQRRPYCYSVSFPSSAVWGYISPCFKK